MPPLRTCSECAAPLSGKSVRAVTCSDRCRLARSRRIRRANREVEEFAQHNNAGAQEIAAIVRREAPSLVTRVMADQLAPIVREALTEDVLRAVDALVHLTPRAVELLAADLESEDSTVRQRAYTLVTKYTVGHPALIKSEDTDPHSQLVVNFNLPRPGAAALSPSDAITVEDEDSRVCDMCHAEKGAGEFVSGSTRCADCFAQWRETVMEQFA